MVERTYICVDDRAVPISLLAPAQVSFECVVKQILIIHTRRAETGMNILAEDNGLRLTRDKIALGIMIVNSAVSTAIHAH